MDILFHFIWGVVKLFAPWVFLFVGVPFLIRILFSIISDAIFRESARKREIKEAEWRKAHPEEYEKQLILEQALAEVERIVRE